MLTQDLSAGEERKVQDGMHRMIPFLKIIVTKTKINEYEWMNSEE